MALALAATGLLIRKRAAPSGDLLGYKVALPDDLNKDGEPVFYPGARLAPDLSLPRIRERWAGDAQDVPAARRGDAIRTGPGSPAAARRGTASAVWQAVLVVEHGEDAVAAAHIAAAGEVLDALAKTSAAHTRRELRDAAAVFPRSFLSAPGELPDHHFCGTSGHPWPNFTNRGHSVASWPQS